MARRRDTSHLLDWDAARLLYELRRRGLNWDKAGAFAEGEPIKGGGARKVTVRSWPRAERAVAAALGVPVEVIWPSRYPARRGAA